MISVWSVCVETKYSDEDVYILKNMVSRHLDEPHNFYCLSDRQIGDLNCLIPAEKWPGWWSKLLLFRYAGGQNLYFDLDVVIVGDLKRLVSGCLSMPANWAQSGHGGCQSSVMSWSTDYDDYSMLADEFDVKQLKEPRNGNCGSYGDLNLWGDQEYITAKLGEPGNEVVPMDHVYSYKYHCLNKVPEDASVVCFHGNPKPKDVRAKWVIQARS